MKTKKKIGRPLLPKKDVRKDYVGIRLDAGERKKLDSICEETEKTISDLVRFRVLNLSEGEIEAIRSGA
jgi:hypothetical protein